MNDKSAPKTFNFEKWANRSGEFVELIRRFAAHDALRSADVEELVLDDDFHRRALRPEDLSFLDFSRPVTADKASRLGFLAAQRLLLSTYELAVAGHPRDATESSFARVEAFYGDEHRVLGERVLPFLESYAFDFLERTPEVSDAGSASPVDRLQTLLEVEAAFWRRAIEDFGRTDYFESGLRFSLIQTWSLLGSKRAALGRAVGARFFEPLGVDLLPRLALPMSIDSGVQSVAARCGVERKAHAYWQFYLSTSLASCNLLHALARRPDRALRLYGAAFAAEAQWLGVGCLAGMAASRLGVRGTKRSRLGWCGAR